MRTLKKKAEFDFVYKNGKRYCGEFFNLYALFLQHRSLQNKTFNYKERKVLESLLQTTHTFTLGLSVSKKIGNSPQRNFIKRRFRGFCRDYGHFFPQMVVIFMAKNGVEKISYAQLRDEVLDFLPKARGKNHA